VAEPGSPPGAMTHSAGAARRTGGECGWAVGLPPGDAVGAGSEVACCTGPGSGEVAEAEATAGVAISDGGDAAWGLSASCS